MTINALADQYFAMWNEADADRRASLIAESWAQNATFVDPSFEVTGHDDLNKLVGAAQQMGMVAPEGGPTFVPTVTGDEVTPEPGLPTDAPTTAQVAAP